MKPTRLSASSDPMRITFLPRCITTQSKPQIHGYGLVKQILTAAVFFDQIQQSSAQGMVRLQIEHHFPLDDGLIVLSRFLMLIAQCRCSDAVRGFSRTALARRAVLRCPRSRISCASQPAWSHRPRNLIRNSCIRMTTPRIAIWPSRQIRLIRAGGVGPKRTTVRA